MDYVQNGSSIQSATNKAYGVVGGSLATNPPEPVNMIVQD